MRRLPLATRTFLLSFAPVCLVLIASFLAISAVVHQRIKQDLRETLQRSDELLNRSNAEHLRQNSALLAKLTDSAGLKASVGLLSEAGGSGAEAEQVRLTIETQLWEFQRASLYDLLAICDVHDRTVAAIMAPRQRAPFVPVLTAQNGLVEIGKELYQLQSVPIEIGGEVAASLTLGRRFRLDHLLEAERAVLLKDGAIVRSTFPLQAMPQLGRRLAEQCLNPESGCEVPVDGELYVVSVLQPAQLGAHYQLLGFRSLDAPLRAFRQEFVPILIEVGAAGVIVALLSTLITARSVSRPLSHLASQLQEGAASGVLPNKLDAGNGVHEVDLVADAFNRVAEAERRTRGELILAKDAAESANRLKSEFLTNVSHELRTPINGVLGMSDVLLDTELNEDQQAYAAIIRDSARTLLKLIEDVLDFSELETGRIRLRLRPMNLRAVLDDLVSTTQTRAAAKALRVEYLCTDAIPPVLIGDETRIRQVLLHLGENAVKFTEAGFVRVRAECVPKNGSEVELTVKVEDSGIGLSARDIELVFDRFTQVDGSLTRRQGGTGLGLPLTKGMVELMGGRVGVESSPRRGSTFWVALPLRVAPDVKESSPDRSLVGVQ